ncbi:MAG: tetratricopeptide repeat protein [Tunicatimonas sp.]|uniref:tetratricopeptide repeat protein n=1 Tax=Tunicatimonas sp. TaxID=1940096 RepID=UPI003C7546BE
MRYSITILLSIIGFSCHQSEELSVITQQEDYVRFLQEDTLRPAKIASMEQEAEFWQEKIQQQPNGFTYLQKLGALNRRQFELTGEVKYLHHSDSLFELANSMVRGKRQLGNFIALSSNSIQQHKFQKALDYSLRAYDVTDEKFGPVMMAYDAHAELGQYDIAEGIMKANQKSESFDYLVRLSKYMDQVGDLDSAIKVMEKAVLLHDRKEVKPWALTHLGDLYGHAGQIDQSYDYYLKALSLDPEYLAPLRGIAWIAYSHDRKFDEAEAILQSILRRTALPDAYLLLAEIADYQGDVGKKEECISSFIDRATQPQYGDMYNPYLATLYAEELNDFDLAIELAQKEVQRRPTPQTYDMLAWAYQLSGNHAKALTIVQEHVEDKTSEPEVLYHIGAIYLKNGEKSKARHYLQEVKSAEFELGPLTFSNIKALDSST